MASVLNLLNQTTPDYSETEAERAAGVSIISHAYPPGDPRRIKRLENGEITINIPSDVPTLQQAVDLFPSKVADAVTVLNIESGHALTRGLRLDEGEYSHFVITSEDATVEIDPNFVWLSTISSGSIGDFGDGQLPRNSQNAFVFCNCRAPIWDIVLDLNGSGGHGIVCAAGTTIRFLPFRGCIRAGETNLVCYESRAVFPQGVFHSAGTRGIWAGNTADISGWHVNASGCGENGVHVSRGSKFNLQYLDASNAGRHGADIRRSIGMLLEADLSGATENGLDTRAAMIEATGVIADNCGGTGIFANNASSITVNGGSAQNCGDYGVRALRSFVTAVDFDASDAGADGFRCDQGTLNIRGAVGTLWSGNTANTTDANGTVFRDV